MLNVQTDEKVLEIGCGTGHALLELSKHTGTSGFVVGIDLSRGMIEVTQKRMAATSQERPASLVEGDAVHIPFNRESFNAVFLSFTLELFCESEMYHVLNECHRILKHGGRIGIVSLTKQKKTAVHIYEWFHEHFPILVDCRPIFVQAIVNEAGFHLQQSTTRSMWGLPVEIVVAGK